MRRRPGQHAQEAEFLWLISLSDLMILLFVFFVVLFSFTQTKLTEGDAAKIAATLSGHGAPTTLDQIQTRLLKWVVDKKLLGAVDIVQNEDALVIEIREKVLFGSGEYSLKEGSRDTVALLGAALDKVPAPYRIGIEGHTDDTPVKGGDNWELSVRRAHSLLLALRLAPEQAKRAVILGYGEMRPLAPNRDAGGAPIPENQARNRRVTLRIF